MTGHGFRGVASTILHEQGWPHEHIELQLAHQERDDDDVSAALEDRQVPLILWCGLRGVRLPVRRINGELHVGGVSGEECGRRKPKRAWYE